MARPSLSFIAPLSHSIIEDTLQSAGALITKWDPRAPTAPEPISLFHVSRNEAREFIRCVTDLRRTMHLLVSTHSASDHLVLAHTLMQLAMHRLEKEFYHILSVNRHRLDPDSVSGRSSSSEGDDDAESDDKVPQLRIAGDAISEVERASAIAVCDLRLIADCMIGSGYGKECVKIYKLIRKSNVDEGLYRLGIEKVRSSKVSKMDWEVLERRIKDWVNASKIAVKTLIQGERILCDHVFAASESIRESCFSEISKEGALNLFRFPEVVAKRKNSPDKIFLLIELHEAMCDLWPEIESIFSFESTSAVRLQAFNSLLKLGDTVRTILSDYESVIQKDSSKTPAAGGGIHQLTLPVMNYLAQLADYSAVLSDIVADFPAPANWPLLESYFQSPSSEESPTNALSVRLAWLVLVLLCKLDRKAELYKDVSLRYLFLANNLHFVVDKVRTSNLRSLLGDDWVSKHTKKVKQYAASYEATAWTKALSSLSDNTNPGSMSPEAAKECLRRFNAAVEEAHRKQKSWIVVDNKLRKEIRVSVAKKLVPAYREFYETHVAILRGQLVKFVPNDLANYLSELFRGTASSSSSSSSPSSPQKSRSG